jgi:hypothetical protein
MNALVHDIDDAYDAAEAMDNIEDTTGSRSILTV